MRWVVIFACLVSQCYGDLQRAEKIFCEGSEHEELVIRFIKKHLLKKVGRQSFLDIGPGRGRIAHKLADKFVFVTVVDPEMCFWERFRGWGFQAHFGHFQNVDIRGGFDLVLCSRVLNRVHWQDWEWFIRKMHRCIDGRGLIVINAPRGKWHRFCSSINNQCLNSDDFRDVCRRQGLSVKVTEVKNTFRTMNRDEFREMVFCFVVEDCFTKAQLEFEDRARLARDVDGFIDECRAPDGSFSLVFEMDFFVI